MIPFSLMVVSIYNGGREVYFREEVDYHRGSGRLLASKKGEPVNEE